MDKKRTRSRKPTGRPRGRPPKAAPPAPPPPAAPSAPADIDSMIAGASGPASSADAAASLDNLAREVERETADQSAKEGKQAPAVTGEVFNADGSQAGADASDTPWGQQKSREIAVYIVLLFGVLAMWLGDAWIVEEEEARTVSDATVRAYPDVIATVEREYKWAGPVSALLLLLFTKWVQSKRQPTEAPAPRLPGTAPADSTSR